MDGYLREVVGMDESGTDRNVKWSLWRGYRMDVWINEVDESVIDKYKKKWI